MFENMDRKLKVILSGGGTGGHIYPAVAVAEALGRRLDDRLDILFVGAEGKMEMEKVPALGYPIVGLPVAGLQRRLTLRNLAVPAKVLASLVKARRVIRRFGADVVVGFGGYASAPVLWSAQRMGIPTLIQEQNSYAGVTNKLLASRARRICVAYEGMERFFPADRIVLTGNPLRGRFAAFGDAAALKAEALAHMQTLCRAYYPQFAAVCPGGQMPKIAVRDMHTRWGSCSLRTGTLAFAQRLCVMPPAAQEYVVVHEFCHFAHPNHSPAFWAAVEKVLPDYRQREKLLKMR